MHSKFCKVVFSMKTTWAFGIVAGHIWAIFNEVQKAPKLPKNISQVSLAGFLIVNGAQHSPLPCLSVGPKGKCSSSTQKYCLQIFQSKRSIVVQDFAKNNISSNFLSISSSGFLHSLIQNVQKIFTNFWVFRLTCRPKCQFFEKSQNVAKLSKMIPRVVLRAFYK